LDMCVLFSGNAKVLENIKQAYSVTLNESFVIILLWLRR